MSLRVLAERSMRIRRTVPIWPVRLKTPRVSFKVVRSWDQLLSCCLLLAILPLLSPFCFPRRGAEPMDSCARHVWNSWRLWEC